MYFTSTALKKSVKTNGPYISTPFGKLKNSVKLFSGREEKISTLYFSHFQAVGKIMIFLKVSNGPSEEAMKVLLGERDTRYIENSTTYTFIKTAAGKLN